jgi:hypothetical protein
MVLHAVYDIIVIVFAAQLLNVAKADKSEIVKNNLAVIDGYVAISIILLWVMHQVAYTVLNTKHGLIRAKTLFLFHVSTMSFALIVGVATFLMSCIVNGRNPTNVPNVISAMAAILLTLSLTERRQWFMLERYTYVSEWIHKDRLKFGLGQNIKNSTQYESNKWYVFCESVYNKHVKNRVYIYNWTGKVYTSNDKLYIINATIDTRTTWQSMDSIAISMTSRKDLDCILGLAEIIVGAFPNRLRHKVVHPLLTGLAIMNANVRGATKSYLGTILDLNTLVQNIDNKYSHDPLYKYILRDEIAQNKTREIVAIFLHEEKAWNKILQKLHCYFNEKIYELCKNGIKDEDFIQFENNLLTITQEKSINIYNEYHITR